MDIKGCFSRTEFGAVGYPDTFGGDRCACFFLNLKSQYTLLRSRASEARRERDGSWLPIIPIQQSATRRRQREMRMATDGKHRQEGTECGSGCG